MQEALRCQAFVGEQIDAECLVDRDVVRLGGYTARVAHLDVVGRSEDWGQDRLRALHGLNRRLNSVTIMTYDQLLVQGERLVELLGAEGDRSDEDEPLEDLDTDDIPF